MAPLIPLFNCYKNNNINLWKKRASLMNKDIPRFVMDEATGGQPRGLPLRGLIKRIYTKIVQIRQSVPTRSVEI